MLLNTQVKIKLLNLDDERVVLVITHTGQNSYYEISEAGKTITKKIIDKARKTNDCNSIIRGSIL